jgi:hypothetical protein
LRRYWFSQATQFEGAVDWLGKEISVSLEVNIDYKASWTKAMNALRVLFGEQRKRDSEFRGMKQLMNHV